MNYITIKRKYKSLELSSIHFFTIKSDYHQRLTCAWLMHKCMAHFDVFPSINKYIPNHIRSQENTSKRKAFNNMRCAADVTNKCKNNITFFLNLFLFGFLLVRP